MIGRTAGRPFLLVIERKYPVTSVKLAYSIQPAINNAQRKNHFNFLYSLIVINCYCNKKDCFFASVCFPVM